MASNPTHGKRFGLLTQDNSPKEVADVMKKVGRIVGPMNAVLRAPEYAVIFSRVGGYFFEKTTIPRPLHEIAILLVGRHWNAEFEFFAHRRIALEVGLPDYVCDAVAEGRRPERMTEEMEVVYEFATELLHNKGVSDKTFARAKSTFGERGVIELIGVMGFYSTVCMVLNVDKFPIPEGAKPLPKL